MEVITVLFVGSW